MLGQTLFQQPLFTTIDLNTFVPNDHLLKRLDKVLDLSFIRELAQPYYHQKDGRPSIDPMIFFRMQIVAYMYGIDSDRRLCEEVHLNMAYRWFTRIPIEEKVPDHSSLSRTLTRLGKDFFDDVFDRILEQCRSIGLLKGERLMTDASLFEANASPDSLVKIDNVIDINEPAKKKDSRTSATKKPAEENAEKGKASAAESSKPKKKTSVTNATHISKTDPNAKIVSKAGTSNKRLYYKTHHTADADSRVITDCFVTPGNTGDNCPTEERLTMQMFKYGFKVEEFLADRFYGNGEFYKFLDNLNITAYIPIRRESFNQGHGSNIGFSYDKTKDTYTCKQGHVLTPYKNPVGAAGNTYVYRMLGGHCKTCPIKDNCLSGKGQLKDKTKKINRNINEEYINKAKEHSTTSEFKAHVHERFWKMEGLFAEGKENHCLKRAKYRGIDKVQVQVKMSSIVQNMKRILKHTESRLKGPKAAEMAAGQRPSQAFLRSIGSNLANLCSVIAISAARMDNLKKIFNGLRFSARFY